VHAGLPGCYGDPEGPFSFHPGTTVHLDACMHSNVGFILVPLCLSNKTVWIEAHFPMRPPVPVSQSARTQAVKATRLDAGDVEPFYALYECECEQGCNVFECTNPKCRSKSAAYTPAELQQYASGIFAARLQRGDTQEVLEHVRAARESAPRQHKTPNALTAARLQQALFGSELGHDAQQRPSVQKGRGHRLAPGFLQFDVQECPETIQHLVHDAQEAFKAWEEHFKGVQSFQEASDDFFLLDDESMASHIDKHWAESTCGPRPAGAPNVKDVLQGPIAFMVSSDHAAMLGSADASV